MKTLLGFPDAEILKVVEQVYRGELAIASSVLLHKKQDRCVREVHWELASCMARAGLQSEDGSARPPSRGQRCSCSHFYLMGQFPLSWTLGDRSGQMTERRHPQDNWNWGGIPILGAEIGWGSIRTPLFNDQAGISYPPLAHNNPILPMSSSATLRRTLTCKWDPTNPGAGHCNMIPHTGWRETEKNRLGFTWEGT